MDLHKSGQAGALLGLSPLVRELHIGRGTMLEEARNMTLEYDPLSAEFQANPYPTYKRLRAEDPFHHRMSAAEHL